MDTVPTLKNLLHPGLMFDISKVIHTESGSDIFKNCMNDPKAEENQATLVPIEKAESHFLFAASEDDLNWDSKPHMDELVERLIYNGKENFESVCYCAAGHFLEPPYGTYCPSSLHWVAGKPAM